MDVEVWSWRRRLFAWEEEMVVECIRLLEYVVLQDSIKDIWVWRLHSSKRYNVRSAYHFLTKTEDA